MPDGRKGDHAGGDLLTPLGAIFGVWGLVPSADLTTWGPGRPGSVRNYPSMISFWTEIDAKSGVALVLGDYPVTLYYGVVHWQKTKK